MKLKKKSIAVMILNRNLPKVTERLRSNIKKYNKSISDIYIIDSGSEKKKKECKCKNM